MSDKFKHAIQNMRDIIHFQEIEKLTELEFSELVASHDSPTAKRIEQLERELGEAREQIEANHKGCALLERMVYEAREQRDALINILTDVINEDGTAKSIDRASILLTALKGGSDE